MDRARCGGRAGRRRAGSPTTSAIVRPDGTLLGYQPYGADGLLVADLHLAAATCLLARRYRDVGT